MTFSDSGAVSELLNRGVQSDCELFFADPKIRMSAGALRVDRFNVFSAFRDGVRKFCCR